MTSSKAAADDLITVKQVAEAYYGMEGLSLGRLQAAGRLLKKAGYSTTRIQNVTYVDCPPDTTVDDIVLDIRESIPSLRNRPSPAPALKSRPAPVAPVAPVAQVNHGSMTLDRALSLIERMWADVHRMAEEIHDLKVERDSLRAQLGQARARISPMVRAAMTKYGD